VEHSPGTTSPQDVTHDRAEGSETTILRRAEREHAAVEARRRARYEQVVALQQEGHSLRAIARRAGVCRNTVRR
jgi:DNA-binding NarL/FixJ family response regulator